MDVELETVRLLREIFDPLINEKLAEAQVPESSRRSGGAPRAADDGGTGG